METERIDMISDLQPQDENQQPEQAQLEAEIHSLIPDNQAVPEAPADAQIAPAVSTERFEEAVVSFQEDQTPPTQMEQVQQAANQSVQPAPDKTDSIAPEVWVSEFGLFDLVYLEPARKYQGRMYRLGAEQIKVLSETLGFTARFDHPNIRTAYVDLVKSEGHIYFEIDRNTKPTELNLRYARDRWSASDAGSRGSDSLRPWIKSSYDARFLPEKVFQAVAGQMRLDVDKISNFYIRINLKDRTAGLLAEERYIESFPAQPYQVFALPEGQVATIPIVDVEVNSPTVKAVPAEQRPSQEAGPKYATYSRSEVDRMMKMQTENITAALAGKISAHQRAFVDSVESQEKAFARITEKYVVQFEEARVKLEANTKSMHASAQVELERLNSELTKELAEFRAHVNKNILPISRAIEEKVKEIQVAANRPVQQQDASKNLIMGAIVALLLSSAGSIYMNFSQLSELSGLKGQLSKVLEQRGK